MSSNKTEVLNYIRNVRGRDGAWETRHGFTPTLLGKCVTASWVADNFGGQHWRSNIYESPPGAYPGHSLAVVPSGNGAGGFIVDYTQHDPFIGGVPDIRNETGVKECLASLTGCNDWRKLR